MNGAASLVQTLVNCGVEVCFTNPGTSEMHFVAALDDVEGMRCVLGLFEGVVSGAADGYARIARKPAATLLHLGPGFGNAFANVHNAKKARVGMVNIVGDHATYHLQYETPLNSDIEGIVGTVSHWVRSSESPAALSTDAAQAAQAAHHGQIATLILPADVSWSEDAAPPMAMPDIAPPRRVQSDTIDAIKNLLARGEPTLLLVGGGEITQKASLLLSKIGEHTGARVCVETFPVRVARGEGTGQLERLPYLAEMAYQHLGGLNHIVLVGALEPISFFAYPHIQSKLVPEGCELHTLSTPGDDLEDCLERLIDALGCADVAPRCSVRATLEAPTGDLTPLTVAQSISRSLPSQTIVVDDGATSSLPIYALTEAAPAHDWLSLTGGAIGFGIPNAIGAAIAAPERKVLCLAGDGSAMYTIQALWTIAREQLDVTVVVFSNHKYNILEIEFARTGARGGKPGPNAAAMLDLGQPNLDFVSMATGMGIQASRAATASEFDAQFADAMAQRGPRLIEAMVPPVKLG